MHTRPKVECWRALGVVISHELVRLRTINCILAVTAAIRDRRQPLLKGETAGQWSFGCYMITMSVCSRKTGRVREGLVRFLKSKVRSLHGSQLETTRRSVSISIISGHGK